MVYKVWPESGLGAGDHLEGHPEGQNGARYRLPGLVTASVSWRSGWSGRIWPGRGTPEGFMACKRSGVRIPIAPPFSVPVFEESDYLESLGFSSCSR